MTKARKAEHARPRSMNTLDLDEALIAIFIGAMDAMDM
jgi:hypothetical protein